MRETDRLAYIDVAKGIAILLVITTHIYGLTKAPIDAALNMINSLHNSTFYLSSGILLGLHKGNALEKQTSALSLIWKKMNQLMIPFLLWSALFALATFKIIPGGGYSSLAIALNKLWFLPTLFLSSCVVVLANWQKIKPYFVGFFCIAGLLFFSFFSSMLAKICTYVLIVYIGYFIMDYKRVHNIIGAVAMGIWIFIALIAYVPEIVSVEDTIQTGSHLIIFLVSNIVGSIALVCFLKNIEVKIPKYIKMGLGYLGKNTLVIYILHSVGIYYLEIKQYRIWYHYIIAVVLALGIPLLVTKITKDTAVGRALFHPNIHLKKEG